MYATSDDLAYVICSSVMGEFTLVGLRVVLECARHGSFSDAAARLGYTQSAVSRQVALMEQAAGRPLFSRLARGVAPTEAGRLVVRHAAAVLGEVDATRQALLALDTRPDRVRVGAFSTAMAALVPRAIARRDPRASPREGLSAGLLGAVARGRLDVAVVTAGEAPAGVTLTPLVTDPLFVATPLGHPLADRASVTPAVLRDERWVSGSEDRDSTLLGAWPSTGEIAWVARDWVAKLGLVAAGLGVTVVPGLLVPALPPTVAVVRVDDPAAVRPVAIARRGSTGSDFVEALHDAAAELSAELRHRVRRP